MKHRWTKPRRMPRGLSPRESMELRNCAWTQPFLIARRHCVKCGATIAIVTDGMKAFKWYTAVRIFTPFGGTHKRVIAMPPCEGLPTNYDPPVGA